MPTESASERVARCRAKHRVRVVGITTRVPCSGKPTWVHKKSLLLSCSVDVVAAAYKIPDVQASTGLMIKSSEPSLHSLAAGLAAATGGAAVSDSLRDLLTALLPGVRKVR